MRALSTAWLPGAALLTAALLAAGCAGPGSEPPALKVGVHVVRLGVPEGWQHVDHGREQRFERELNQISLADMGPATAEGFRREILHSRELFRAGQHMDARTVLGALRLRPSFPSERRWSAFVSAWYTLRDVGREDRPLDTGAIERAYADVLAEIDALPRTDIATLAELVLEELGHDERYDIALEEARAIDGRDALLIDTWDRLSHDLRKRHLFILNNGNLLVARMELGRFAESVEAFDALTGSLRFPAGS
jgi:hypothetical protein